MGRPRVFGLQGIAPDPAVLREAAAVLKGGGLVAFPTETVYGLGADATTPRAIERLNAVKGRPPEKPYSLHIYTAEQVQAYVKAVPPAAQRLMARCWPGPLTLVLPADGGGTVGFRLPSHPVALAFLRACGVPVAAPSANRSGAPPPTDAAEVVAALDGDVDCVLDAGPTQLGRESTVAEIVGDRVEIRREGALPTAVVLAAARGAGGAGR